MVRKDLLDLVSDKTGMDKQDIDQILDALIQIEKENIENGESLYLRGFGTFKVTMSAPKPAQDIKNKKTIIVPPRRKIKIILGSELKAIVKGTK